MTKNILQSKTFWANLIALVASVTVGLGWDLGITEQVQGEILAGIMAVVNIGLRMVTKVPVTLKSQ